MGKVILFGGGDGGGLVITKDGVKPLPPFEPFVLAQIKAVAHLATAAGAPGVARGELTDVATRLAGIAFERIEEVAGPLDREAGLIVAMEDGDGFVCGSTGLPPVPIPRPHRELARLT